MDVANTCQLEDVAAYLDGELAGAALDRFEHHAKTCQTCATELRAQRQLLCTLDVAFSDSRSFDLPNNFTRVVTARAENDLSAMRNGRERKRALQLCVLLALVAFALLGAATQTIVIDPVRSFFRVARILFDFLWQAAADAVATLAVLSRVIRSAVLETQPGARLLLVLAFLLSLSCLSFLIARYRRAQIVE
jgi:anti-sigma factor RsiW